MANVDIRLNLKPQWNTRAYSYHPIFLYTSAILLVGCAVIVQMILSLFGETEFSYFLFFAPIMVSAWLGGLKTGLFSSLLSAVIVYWYFTAPFGSLQIKGPISILHFVIFIAEGMLLSYFIQNMHNALKNLELKNAELARSEERFRLVVETVKDYSIYTLDKDGYITSWNAGAEEIKGYTQQEILGKHFSLFYPLEEIERGDPWKNLILAAEHGRREDEGWRIRKDGTRRWTNMVITPIYDENRSLTGFSAISRDLTEKREIEKRKDDFISIASHELKTPVTSIKVFTQVLIKMFQNVPGAPPLKYLMKMDGQLDKLTNLINDLLDVTRIQTGKMELKEEVFDLKQLVEETVENMQAISTNHTIELRGHIKDMIRGDKDRIGQVIINFISNAVKYSPNSNTVIVSLSQDNDNAIISVRDFGIGIPPEYINKIFERFFRIYDDRERTYPGLGMGLFISSEIVRRHNGKVWVESAPGQGSTFYVSLPV